MPLPQENAIEMLDKKVAVLKEEVESLSGKKSTLEKDLIEQRRVFLNRIEDRDKESSRLKNEAVEKSAEAQKKLDAINKEGISFSEEKCEFLKEIDRKRENLENNKQILLFY